MVSSGSVDLSLQELKLQLIRIDILIQREVKRWQTAGQDPNDSYRGLYVTDAEVEQLLTHPIGISWGQSAPLDAEQEAIFTASYEKAQETAEAFILQTDKAGKQLRLNSLTRVFKLDQNDLDILLVCLAPSLDLKYERIFGYLQDDVTRKQPGTNLVLNLLAQPGTDRFALWSHMTDEAPLFKYQLVGRSSDTGKVPLLRESLTVDATIVNWLLGQYQPRQELIPYLHLTIPEITDNDQLIASRVVDDIQVDRYRDPHIIFYGPDIGSQDSTARYIAANNQRPLLTTDLGGMIREGLPAVHCLRTALRDSLLTGAIPYITGWDAAMNDDGFPSPALLTEICNYQDAIFISGLSAWQASGIERTNSFLWVPFDIPSYSQRCLLWHHYLIEISPGSSIEVNSLAGQFLLTNAQIRDACATASDTSKQNRRAISVEDLYNAARAHSNPRLATLAKKVFPRYKWQDIVLPIDQLAILHEIIDTVLGRPKVLEEWGVGEKLAPSSGVTVLFSGPPGTGKTMAAQIIAGDLGLDLYKIDLSSIVSKYIGETEKNMERIFSEAESSNAILFFDEADALFGKRSEVRDSHDRYANIEISYLLQRMEAYDGVTILATNLRANLDEAFTRRLQFSVNFPFPDETDRLRIWETLFPPGLPREANIDLPLLAKRFRLAGGNIRNIIVNAAYLASADGGIVTMTHLFHSTHREYQKLGRLLKEDDLVSGL